MLYQEASAVTNDFNHPNKDYVSFTSTDSFAQMVTTVKYDQNSGCWSHGSRPWIA